MKKIWLLTGKNTNVYKREQYLKEAQKLQLDLEEKHIENFFCTHTQSELRLFYEEKLCEDLPNVVISINGNQFNHNPELNILLVLEQLSIEVINSAAARKVANDKWLTQLKLLEKNIPVIPTRLLEYPFQIPSEVQFPVILKVLNGALGKGVVYCQTKENLKEVIDIYSLNSVSPLLLQDYIKDSGGAYIRVMVIKDRAIGAIHRTPGKDQRKTSTAFGGTFTTFPISEDLEKIAAQATQSLGLEYAGVDILKTKEGYLVCEVNANPGFQKFDSLHKKCWVKHIFESI